MNLLRSFIRDERGEDLIEYGLQAAFVAGLALALFTHNTPLRTTLIDALEKTRVTLTTL